MATVYTIEGARSRRSGRKSPSAAQRAAQNRFRAAAKACKGKGGSFKSCMRKQLSR